MPSINHLTKIFKKELFSIKSNSDLEQLKIKYLGRNGVINKLFKDINNASLFEKKQLGKKINKLKTSIKQFIENRRQELIKKNKKTNLIDTTLPGIRYPKGSLHVMTLAIEEISHIFEKLGFIRVSYPEVEWEYLAFEALNMPKNHPARDDFETFYIEACENKKYGRMILTPHTSSGQVREMLRICPPIRMINIGKCYRPNWDITHTPMFYQFEGLCIDRDINITHLKGTVDYFAKEFFGSKREIRLRPHHFQFTEPSFEIDVSCEVCGGKGCRVCKSGWMELAGAGMVHPNVLKAGGLNPKIYSGWAFGFGPERCIMMKTGVSDIRDFYNNDIRFLEQF
jgi:phenylalanyl-tRNA synthetase alpha chain